MRKGSFPPAALALAAALAVTGVTACAAEEYAGAGGWKVTFDGERMASNFTTGAMSDTVYGMQPGDVVTLGVALENTADYTTDWYMTNEVLSSLEDSQGVAEGGVYSYTLAYTSGSGAVTTLYDSEAVGGEETTGMEGEEGLHEATDSLEDFFYLDTLASGGSGTVSLTVSLDGETQGNAYQDTLADLQMNFAVERSQREPGEGTQTVTPVPVTPTPGTTGAAAPSATPVPRPTREPGRDFDAQTGDDTRILPFALAALASGAVVLCVALWRRRKEKGGPGDE